VTAPGARVRVANFEPFLRSDHIALRYRSTMTDAEYRIVGSSAGAARKATVLARSARRSMARLPDHDVLLVHRLRLLTPLPGVDPPPRLDVYDLDDALFVGSAAAVNRRFQWAKQEARRCVACLRRARLVIAGNAFLADTARQYTRRVEVVPSCVDPALQRMHAHGPADVITVGWIGSPTTSVYLEPLLPVFAELNRRRMEVKLVVVGGDLGVRADWLEHRDWSPETEADDIASFDIGVMPMPDTEWTRGKCGYKVLQYFAAGVPAVASPVGVAAELIGSDRGLCASAPHEWRSALERLIEDVEERRERGLRARAFVERNYSYQRWAPELAALLRSVA
jgi:glycosyltransferase involved in cell wall biosynthesis